ncbi:restriction endonuclease subunit S [Corynebacterium diphtheriae]|nr:restriction endonuclease subunit S [Corynebacterium diphtheriae]CAB1030530.1 restriction endonuclease subunit S [Corynebacterium diphtheriae]
MVDVTINQDLKAVTTDPSILPRFVLYYLRNSSQDILRTVRKTGGSVASLDTRKLFAFPMPIPPLEEQQRIVNILDKFDALVNDLTSGLPAEIEARRKQYEYYRDQLLTFKELAA